MTNPLQAGVNRLQQGDEATQVGRKTAKGPGDESGQGRIDCKSIIPDTAI